MAHVHGDVTVPLGELHRVRHQVPDHLLQPLGVAADRGQGVVHRGVDRDLLGFRRRPDDVDGRVRDFAHVHRFHVETQLAADHPRHVEQILDQAQLRRGVTFDHLERVRARLDVRLRAQDPRPAEHRVERRADFMRQRREEFVLQARRLFGHAARVLRRRNLAAQLPVADDAFGHVLDDGSVPTTTPSTSSGAMRALCAISVRPTAWKVRLIGIRYL